MRVLGRWGWRAKTKARQPRSPVARHTSRSSSPAVFRGTGPGEAISAPDEWLRRHRRGFASLRARRPAGSAPAGSHRFSLVRLLRDEIISNDEGVQVRDDERLKRARWVSDDRLALQVEGRIQQNRQARDLLELL